MRPSTALRSLAFAALVAATSACTGVGPFSPTGGPAGSLVPTNPVLLAVGARQQLALPGDIGDIGGDQPIRWTSNAPSVASVDGAGFVTAEGDGTATITAEFQGMTWTASVTVAATIVNSASVSSDQTDDGASNDTAAASITVLAP